MCRVCCRTGLGLSVPWLGGWVGKGASSSGAAGGEVKVGSAFVSHPTGCFHHALKRLCEVGCASYLGQSTREHR